MDQLATLFSSSVYCLHTNIQLHTTYIFYLFFLSVIEALCHSACFVVVAIWLPWLYNYASHLSLVNMLCVTFQKSIIVFIYLELFCLWDYFQMCQFYLLKLVLSIYVIRKCHNYHNDHVHPTGIVYIHCLNHVHLTTFIYPVYDTCMSSVSCTYN